MTAADTPMEQMISAALAGLRDLGAKQMERRPDDFWAQWAGTLPDTRPLILCIALMPKQLHLWAMEPANESDMIASVGVSTAVNDGRPIVTDKGMDLRGRSGYEAAIAVDWLVKELQGSFLGE